MKYIKKPVVIEAVQFTRENVEICRSFTQMKLKKIMVPKCIGGKMTGTLESSHEEQVITEGDFIIKGAQGELYSCKPEIFYETYEEFKEESKWVF